MTKRLRSILLNILFLIMCVAIAYGISNYMFTSIKVDGISMENTLHDNDRVLIYKIGKYKRGDVVVLNTHQPTPNGEKHLVKRIIGMPGDTVEIMQEDDGEYYVYLNGEKLHEDYTNKEQPMREAMSRITVSAGEFFYLGDNRGPSADSRKGEMGQLDSIVGRVMLRYKTDKWDMDIIRRVSLP